MKLHGLQKMTLLDFPGRVACTVFLGGCDFRCPFCHNYELIDGTAQPLMEEEEFFRFLQSRKGLIEGVAITGGEPCLHKDLPEFMRKIRAAGYPVKLDTNGYHPEMLKAVLEEGLVEYVAMDVKNCAQKYALTCGLEQIDMDIIRESISIIMHSGAAYEFRTTVIDELHEADDFEGIGEMIQGAQQYFLQRFTDRDSVPYGNLSAPSFDKMHALAKIAEKYVKNTKLRGVE
ncbi:MAG: anaerobic ribonucleoside-triphosphate reductase activating protein [Clostridia bacterium]|nr:anaerobic ribonucleoside-triphosphate reductase activating protein [Clostridia bacterium]